MTATIASSAKPYLQIQGLVKKFGDNYAVDHIDLDIEKHEIFALLGSSGSGKSTLLRMLAGMEIPNQGKIILDGQDITKLAPYDRPINMMFQKLCAIPAHDGGTKYRLRPETRQNAERRNCRARGGDAASGANDQIRET